jgi:hypothetical protein
MTAPSCRSVHVYERVSFRFLAEEINRNSGEGTTLLRGTSKRV